MKKCLQSLLWLTMTALLAAGCGEDRDDGDGPAPDTIWDFSPALVRIYVTDPSGRENLLDPDAGHSIADLPIAAVYDGKRYELDRETLVFGPEATDGAEAQTRALPARFYGLCLRYNYRDNWHLVFGEFGGGLSYKGESFVIEWGDGTETQIAFDFYTTWKNHLPTTHYRIYVDGEDLGSRLHCVLRREI